MIKVLREALVVTNVHRILGNMAFGGSVVLRAGIHPGSSVTGAQYDCLELLAAQAAVAIENAISYPKAVRVGDVITATCEEESSSNRLGFYRVVVRNQEDDVVSTFRGTVYKTEKEHV